VGVLFSPHADDETLFAAFTILRHRPDIVVCFGSAGDYGPTDVRTAETREAMTVLGGGVVEQWGGGDLVAQMRSYDARVNPVRVWAPHEDASHPEHVAVARAARQVFGDRLQAFHTYDVSGKVRRGRPVAFEPAWVQQKLRALLRYETQVRHPRACQFFTWDLLEYAE
jgi:LmbE family N-acetylglucosaminyl deacetylase